MGDEKKKPDKKAEKKKLELNKETVQELTDEELGDVAGGYNSNGCGTAYSYAGQLTCNPDPRNIESYRRCQVE